MFGLLNLNKPTGVTSRRVVDQVKRLVKPAKVGHAGTLDPLASGLLIVAIGQATRLVEYLHELPKTYRATFLLGRTSTTEDIEGDVTMLADVIPPARAELERAAAELTGEILQRPPAFSALKVGGRRAYDLARSGQHVELTPRPVTIYRLEVLEYAYPELTVHIECSGGTYVRSLGRDLAERAGSAAVMATLVRTSIGSFRLEEAIDPATLSRENIAAALVPPLRAVEHIATPCTVSADEVASLSRGQSIRCELAGDGPFAACDTSGRLVAILTRSADGALRPEKYFPSLD